MAYAITEKNTNRPEGKEKIYVTGHEADKQWMQVLTKELLQFLDGKYYVALQQIEEDEWEEHLYHLKNMNLVVIAVTKRFLVEANIARERELIFAKEQGIPVLPIMLEEGLEEAFDKICGEMHLLNRGKAEYPKMLKEYLELLFGDGDLRAEVDKVFAGRIFLSYRKKDYKVAMQLIRRIHGLEGCVDIAIWYDDYLKFGEDYNEEIAYYLKNCDLMVLNVTPSLLEPKNYVMRVEYPAAVNEGKVVVPVEMVGSTGKTGELKQNYPGLGVSLQGEDLTTLRAAILNALHQSGVGREDFSPEKKYFLGEAYFNGIHVEIDRQRGLALMEEAGQEGVIRAMFRLGMLYKTGTGVAQDFRKARIWLEKDAQALEALMDTEENAIGGISRALATSLLNLSEIYMIRKYTKRAEETLQRLEEVSAYNIRQGFMGTATNPGVVYLRKGIMVKEAGRYEEAAELYSKAEPILMEMYRQCPTKQSAINYSLLREAQGMLQLDFYENNPSISLLYPAVKYQEEAVEVQRWVVENWNEACEAEKYISFMINLGVSYDKLGRVEPNVEKRARCYEKGRELFGELRARQDLASEQRKIVESNYCLMLLQAGAFIEVLGDMKYARELYQEAYSAYSALCRQEGMGTPEHYFALASVCISLAVAGMNPPDFDLLQQAYQILEFLCQAVPENAQFKSYRNATLYRLQIWPASPEAR